MATLDRTKICSKAIAIYTAKGYNKEQFSEPPPQGNNKPLLIAAILRWF